MSPSALGDFRPLTSRQQEGAVLAILAACAAMAARDALATFLTVAENRGKALLAGAFDALGDLATIGVTALGAGQIIIHGLTTRTILLLAAMTATSFAGTALWTRLAQHIGQP